MYKFINIKSDIIEVIYGSKILYFEVNEVKTISIVKNKNHNNMAAMVLISLMILISIQQLAPIFLFIAASILVTAINIWMLNNNSSIYYIRFKRINKNDVWLKIKKKDKDGIKKEIMQFTEYKFNYSKN